MGDVFKREGLGFDLDGGNGGKIKIKHGNITTGFLWEKTDKKSGFKERGVSTPENSIVITALKIQDKVEEALATPRFEHLKEHFNDYPDARKKKYFLMGHSEEHRMDNDLAILDLIHHLSRK
tara:strand:+ start:116 stop:481 length:366 start_codon:yes stop_codon:yes gene_type:complete